MLRRVTALRGAAAAYDYDGGVFGTPVVPSPPVKAVNISEIVVPKSIRSTNLEVLKVRRTDKVFKATDGQVQLYSVQARRASGDFPMTLTLEVADCDVQDSKLSADSQYNQSRLPLKRLVPTVGDHITAKLSRSHRILAWSAMEPSQEMMCRQEFDVKQHVTKALLKSDLRKNTSVLEIIRAGQWATEWVLEMGESTRKASHA
eukprot:TRINITY_DN43610_c0_g1_i1.p1 TRINITY_DN43610_c0_g1~~TRINITY_DN43610_c0_g1_i1.p1  ORF type:complete len:203 (+),score=60.02 TRINITY_DN43610_c0_g1_i1:16-624(+)